MRQAKNRRQGFTLIAALIILVLLSGVAAGLMFMVSNETRMGGNDLENNLAYYGAESGMEKLTADVSQLYSQYQSPSNAQIQNLINFPPDASMVSGMAYNETITYPFDANGNPASSWNTISSGANQGLGAQIIPMSMQVIATRPAGASVNITRKVEVALIPVFQFGVFCGYDCSYFPGPNFGFGGRVHTNGNLFLAAGGDLVFNDKIAAFKHVVLDRLENGWVTTAGYGGSIYVPKASGGCALVFPPPGPNCPTLAPGEASWTGGFPNISGELWCSVNERDALGDNLVPDYITHVQDGGFYGWPWWYMGAHQDPRHAGKHPELKEKAIVPDVLLQAHNASLQFTFYQGDKFPAEYKGDIFASEHGSWNKAVRVGYEVIRIPLHGTGHATGEYEDFVTGFVLPNGDVWGRPVGMTEAQDGSLLVSDDGSNSIWRVSYTGK